MVSADSRRDQIQRPDPPTSGTSPALPSHQVPVYAPPKGMSRPAESHKMTCCAVSPHTTKMAGVSTRGVGGGDSG
jgi:hypothetical protein